MNGLAYELFFKALSNTSRRSIINSLREKPKNVGELAEELGYEQSRVSHSLRALQAGGFVSFRQDGKERIYSIDAENIEPILEKLDIYMNAYGEKLSSCGILKGGCKCIHPEKEE